MADPPPSVQLLKAEKPRPPSWGHRAGEGVGGGADGDQNAWEEPAGVLMPSTLRRRHPAPPVVPADSVALCLTSHQEAKGTWQLRSHD